MNILVFGKAFSYAPFGGRFVTASYIVLSGAPNLHLLSFHLFTLRLSYLSPHTLWIIMYVNSLSVTSFTFLKPVSLHKFLVCASFSVFIVVFRRLSVHVNLL